jgi:hypothetical protein
VFDVDITSYRIGSGGIQLGTPGSTYDTCSNKFVNVRTNIHMVPAAVGLWLPNSDSNEFVNMYFGGDNTGIPISSILSTGTTTATITVPNHGLPSTASSVGVFIFNACSTALVAGVCGGTEIRGLEGVVTATYVDASHLNITGAYGLTNATTYYAEKILPVDVSLGGCGNCGGNKFATLTASVFMEPSGGGGFGNHIANWNWVNDGNGANPAYQRLGGNWVGHVFADGLSNFASIASIHGGRQMISDGQVKLAFRDQTGPNHGTNQQMFGIIYDGGNADPGGALTFQSLTDENNFAANLLRIW